MNNNIVIAIIGVSFCFTLAYIAMLVFQKPHDRTGVDKGRIMDTVHLVRIIYLAGLCAVPALFATSLLRDNMHLYTMTETGVPIISGALLLVGLMSLGQRALATRFGMHTAFKLEEIYVMMAAPVALYLIFIPGRMILQYIISPGIYSVYLIVMTRRRALPDGGRRT
jgi:hypothetical protein